MFKYYAVLGKDMRKPGQTRFSCSRIYLPHRAVQKIARQTVDFQNPNPSRLCFGSRLSIRGLSEPGNATEPKQYRDNKPLHFSDAAPLAIGGGTRSPARVEPATTGPERARAGSSLCRNAIMATAQSVCTISSWERLFKRSSVATACALICGELMLGIRSRN